jgi:hypothetical protein
MVLDNQHIHTEKCKSDSNLDVSGKKTKLKTKDEADFLSAPSEKSAGGAHDLTEPNKNQMQT